MKMAAGTRALLKLRVVVEAWSKREQIEARHARQFEQKKKHRDADARMIAYDHVVELINIELLDLAGPGPKPPPA